MSWLNHHRSNPGRSRVRPRGDRIGIPRSLAFDELRCFFDSVLQSHGQTPFHSPRSSPEILRLGSSRCIDEVCFPLKTFFGHLAALLEQGVDTVLVPRIISTARGRNLCPKFHVLPDLVEQSFPEFKVLSPYLDLHHAKKRDFRQHLFAASRAMLIELGAWHRHSTEQLTLAWQREKECRIDPPDPPADQLTVALVGHTYGERDPFLNLHSAKTLSDQGVAVVGSPAVLPVEPSFLEEGIYYEPTFRTARAIDHHLRRGVDGLVLATYFACGPDSYGADTFLYRLKRQQVRVPVLRLIFDEHTAPEGLITRLTTFVDVARHYREQRLNESC